MPRPGLPTSSSLRMLALFLVASLCPSPATARGPKASRYPLHVHVLAADETYKTPRMRPEDSVVCDAMEGISSSTSPSGGSLGGALSVSGISSDPCSFHIAGALLDLQNEMAFSGAGRADLVSPPSGTQGFNFRYDDCGRVRVHPGFHSLPARWKKPGQKLEVLVPSDDIPVNGRPPAPLRCTMTVTLQDYVYLLLRNGTMVEVSQADYWRRPILRVFLSGNVPTVQQRLGEFTTPAHPTN